MSYLHITKENFEELVLKAEKKVLLDFWATWCGPCKMIAPIVEEIAEENEHIVLAKVNVDEEPELAIRYGISSIPTLLFFENGEKKSQLIGFRPKADILKFIAD